MKQDVRETLWRRAVGMELGAQDLRRYARQLLLPGVSTEGQQRLKTAKVLIVGMGGLGCPVAAYLAAAGVGCLGLMDDDQVESSNLQRQILHGVHDVGRAKVDSARDSLRLLNDQAELITHGERLTRENAVERVSDYDVVVDGTDQFSSRYILNDACVATGRPLVYGSLFQFEGQVSVFGMEGGACYRCLLPDPPRPGSIPSCAEGGVLGAVAGVVGSLQAVEVLKWITGQGDLLSGRMLYYSSSDATFRTLQIPRNTSCLACGEHADLLEQGRLRNHPYYMTSTESCGNRNSITAWELSVALRSERPPKVLDVRSKREAELLPIAGAHLEPLNELPGKLHRLDMTAPWVVICQESERAQQAVKLLRDAGWNDVRMLQGGLEAWLEQTAYPG
ncbi:MAG: molybdopterin-synthase adenylyltransferase MoeB [Candidatus Methylacidiphilales bacterium]